MTSAKETRKSDGFLLLLSKQPNPMRYHQRRWQEVMEDDLAATSPVLTAQDLGMRLAMDRERARQKHREALRAKHAAIDQMLHALPLEVVEHIKDLAGLPILPVPRALFQDHGQS